MYIYFLIVKNIKNKKVQHAFYSTIAFTLVAKLTVNLKDSSNRFMCIEHIEKKEK